MEVNHSVPAEGLTHEEAENRLRHYGPNAVEDAKPHLFLAIAKKFWAPEYSCNSRHVDGSHPTTLQVSLLRRLPIGS